MIKRHIFVTPSFLDDVDKIQSANTPYKHKVVGEIVCLGGRYIAPGIGHVGVLPLSLSFSLQYTEGLSLGRALYLGVSSNRPRHSCGPGTRVAPNEGAAGTQPRRPTGTTPHLSPPSLPVPLTRGTRQGNGCQVRHRCRPG